MAFTFFFRDLPTLDAIRDRVIPQLRRYKYINVWDAGCAMGPEPYSLAIIFKESLGFYEFKRLKIYATDLDEESHEFGKIIAKGMYPEESVKRIPRDIFGKYFSPNNKPGHYKISDEIIQCVTFQSVCTTGGIVCQIVYFNKNIRQAGNIIYSANQRIEVIHMFHKALAPGGFFVCEQTQKMPEETVYLFEHITPNVQLFRKA